MIRLSKKTVISLIVVICLFSTIVFAAGVSVYKYDNAALSFSGIHIVVNSESHTVQGIVDVSLKNINVTGTEFCVKYDKNYVELSSYDKNELITNASDVPDGLNRKGEFFKQNPDIDDAVFLNQAVLVPGMGYVVDSPLSRADPNSGYFSMNFSPIKDCKSYIQVINGRRYIVANSDSGLSLGKISFSIKDPEAFAKLSADKLAGIIKVVPFSEMYGIDNAKYGKAEYGVWATYTEQDEEGNYYTYTDNSISIDYEIKIKSDLLDVRAPIDDFTVNAYEIYKNGSEQDLYDFLNKNASIMHLIYTDDSEYPVTVNWNSTNSVIDKTWNVKGNAAGEKYKVTYSYGGAGGGATFKVVVTVRVNPVSLKSFYIKNQNITYIKGSTDFPQTIYDLSLPTQVHPVLDVSSLDGVVGDLDILTYTYRDTNNNPKTFQIKAGADLTDANAYMQMFDATSATKSYTIGIADNLRSTLTNTYAWLTLPLTVSNPEIIRNVVMSDDIQPGTIPPDITATATTDDNGELTITVQSVDGSAISNTTSFELRLPDSELIDTTQPGITYNAVYNADGTVTIKLSANILTAEKVAKAINLGERMGKFSITAVKTETVVSISMTFKSAEAFFSSNPRKNLYKAPENGTEIYYDADTYIFDYSLKYSALFPVKNLSSLPETVTLPAAPHKVATTYDGVAGGEPGALTTITVDSWTVVNIENDTYTVEGTLKDDAVYTNYGKVSNTNGIKVRIKYCTVDNASDDRIAIDPTSFKYNIQQVGYGLEQLQEKGFKITNIGTDSIYGLNALVAYAKIDGSTTNTKEAFVVTQPIPLILGQGDSAYLNISNKLGLEKGVYTADVTIYSNNGALGTISLVFEVTDAEVYNIILEVKDKNGQICNYGTAETTTGSTTSVANVMVSIIAKSSNTTDYKFVEWQTTDSDILSSVTAAQLKSPNLSFQMPAHDVTIAAVFEETVTAKLQAEELYVLPGEDSLSADKKNALALNDKDWQAIQFSPSTSDYFVVVSNETEKVNLQFKLRNTTEAQNSQKTVKMTRKNASDTAIGVPISGTVNSPVPPSDYYNTNAISVDVGPTKNVIELSFTDSGSGTIKTYNITVYRKIKESDKVEFKYGNSPVGRIMRDTTITAANRANQASYFVTNNYKFITGNYVPPHGVAADFVYTTKAWGTSDNLDIDRYALFIVNTLNSNDDVYDPGYVTLKNSIGQTVTDPIKHKRTHVKLLQLSGNGSAADFGDVEERTIDLDTNGDMSDLLNYRIRPDIYELEYIYNDYDGNSTSVKKPMVIIYPFGDINADGKTDDDDALRIRERYKSGSDIANAAEVVNYSKGAELFKHRVVDVNADGYVSMLDCNAIERLINNIDLHERYVNLTSAEKNY